MWNPSEVEFIFRSYQTFEQKLLDTLRVLPFTGGNKAAWSPELVNIFIDVSSLIDSLSRNVVGQWRGRDEFVDVRDANNATVSRKVRDLGIDDFEVNLFNDLRLLDSRVVVYVYPLQVLAPYRGYRNHDTGWWAAYNSLKHDRVRHYALGNLENALTALAALFLLLVRCKEEELTKAIVRFDWLVNRPVPEFVHMDRIREPQQYWFDSELFGTHEVPENVPEDITRIHPPLTSSKFQRFFGRYNP